MRRDTSITIAAIGCLLAGLALSRVVEPTVRVETIFLKDGTPALRFRPVTLHAHPVAVLAHGVTASKETLFRFGEALAAVDIECYAVDLAGHGASPRKFDFRAMETALADTNRDKRADIFLGHSMGSYVGAGAVRRGLIDPKLFIAVGALPNYGPRGPRLLLLAGTIEEAVSLARLKARTDAQWMLFPWCDHAGEPYDPALVNAAVDAAREALGMGPPNTRPRAWIWRLLGLFVGLAGASVLAVRLPAFGEHWKWMRGLLVAGILIAAVSVLGKSWFSMAPHWRHFPQQILFAVIAWLVIWLAAKARVPRWTFTVVAIVITVFVAAVGLYFLALVAAIGAVILAAGRLVGLAAARQGTNRDGDLATAIFVGYCFGELLPAIF